MLEVGPLWWAESKYPLKSSIHVDKLGGLIYAYTVTVAW